MKKLLMSSFVLAVFSASMILFQFSCKKDAVAQTGTPADKPTKDEMLVAKTWQIDKLHHVISNQYSSYTRGGANTTGINYDVIRFTFLPNGKGIYIDQSSTTRDFTWEFTSSDKRAMKVTVLGHTDTWEMVEIADNYLHASVNLILDSGSNNIETFRFIQVP